MNPTDYRPKWYEDVQPEAAHAASEIDDDDHSPLTPGEVYIIAAIWCLSAACAIALIAWVIS